MGGLSCDDGHFYPRSPCGERPPLASRAKTIPTISIHALLAESDPSVLHNFQPLQISIHALLAESDRYSLRHSTPSGHFYPRSPCGERPTDMRHRLIEFGFLSTLSLRRATVVYNIVFVPGKFLSTLSLRRATSGYPETHQPCAISIHALLAESDRRGAVPVILII